MALAKRQIAVAAQNDSWKAQGFLNFYLPSKDGSTRKLGAIPLRSSKPAEMTLLEWLKEDPTRAENILLKLSIDFREVNDEASSFDLF